MSLLWVSISGLIFLALLFMAWPLWRYRNVVAKSETLLEPLLNQRLAENVRLFREHLLDLENSLALKTIDAEQFAQLKIELQKKLLDDDASLRSLDKTVSPFPAVKVAMGFFILVLIAGVGLYQYTGSASDVAVRDLYVSKAQHDYEDMLQNRDPDPVRARHLAEQYKQQLEKKPESLQYWFLLARTQMEIGEFGKAVDAYQHLLSKDSQSPMIMAELAQAMFLRDNNKVTPATIDLAKRAVALDPNNTMALGLLGIDAFNNKSYKETVRYWRKAVELMGPNSEGARALSAGIERAKQEYIKAGGVASDLESAPLHKVTVYVTVSANVNVSPEQTVFIYARGWQGSPMPLAIARVKVSELPKLIILDETMAMSPAASLANATDIEVVARISTDGTAQAKPGDWQAAKGPLSMKTLPEKIDLHIDTRIGSGVAKP